MLIENVYINNTFLQADGAWSGGMEFFDGKEYHLKNCIIDLSDTELDEMDEALAFTWGCFGSVTNCVIRGAGKLVLFGSGDKDKIDIEKGKEVVFNHCIFENFSRRGPEVQDGMRVIIRNSLIRNWGDRFDIRSFGAWAHTEDSYIRCENTIFEQNKFFKGHFFSDFIHHFGQAVNDAGIRGIFSKAAWQPGVCKGLVATCGGEVEAFHCYKNKWWIDIENNDEPMDIHEANELRTNLLTLKSQLYQKLSPISAREFKQQYGL